MNPRFPTARRVRYLTAVTFGCLGITSLARAHPISLTDALVDVRRDQVSVRLELFVEDLLLFHNLQPNARDFLEPEVIRQGIRQHQAFLQERFVLRDVHGEQLVGQPVSVSALPLEPDGIRLADLMAHRLTYQFVYSFQEPPEFLTFSQHLTDERTAVPVEMQLRVHQAGSGSRYEGPLKLNEPQTVRFRWDQPPLSAEVSQQEWDQWYARQKAETLGITSYSSVYSFLYINDQEIRHEILVPLLTLQASVPLQHQDEAFLEVSEQDAARSRIAAFFSAGNPVDIDGVTVKPAVQRIDFYGLDFMDFARPAETRRVSLASARVGIILAYSTKGAPTTVRLTWDRFNRYLWNVDTIVYAPDQTLKKTLSRIKRDNYFEWRSPGGRTESSLSTLQLEVPPRPTISLPVPFLVGLVLLPGVIWVGRRRGMSRRVCGAIGSLVMLGLALAWPYGHWEVADPSAPPVRLSDAEARTIFTALHRNIYRAFDCREESEVYDALARSVSGPLLRELYLKIHRSLEMQEQGGAIAHVQEAVVVEGRRQPLSEESADRRGFGFQCRWTVRGTVEHWGHVHSRTNQYEGKFRVEPQDNVWKITGLQLMHEQRLNAETTLRGL